MKLSGIRYPVLNKIISSCNNNKPLNPLIKDSPEHKQIYKNWLDTLMEYGTLLSIRTDSPEDIFGPRLHLEKGAAEKGLF